MIGLENTNSFDSFLYESLVKTVDRLWMNPMNNILKGALLGNFLSAFVYNSNATLKFCEDQNITSHLMYELLNNDFINYHLY